MKLKKQKFGFELIILNIISILIIVIQSIIQRENVFLTVVCVSFTLLSGIYLVVSVLNRLVDYFKYKLFKYETQNLNMLIFNNRWNSSPSFDCLNYISNASNYDKKGLDNLLEKSKNFSGINSFELYQEFINSLSNFSLSELKNMNSFLNIKFRNNSYNVFSNNFFVSIFLFILTIFFGIDIDNGKVNFDKSFLYRLFQLTNNFSVELFVTYVFGVIILFVLLMLLVKSKQKRTVLIMTESIKRAIEIQEDKKTSSSDSNDKKSGKR